MNRPLIDAAKVAITALKEEDFEVRISLTRHGEDKIAAAIGIPDFEDLFEGDDDDETYEEIGDVVTRVHMRHLLGEIKKQLLTRRP
jgi:3'-phosphoadenosine 5'-phosphosulfate (PAPS) 3'-phosphatase